MGVPTLDIQLRCQAPVVPNIGWWYTYPSEKYETQFGLLFPIYRKIKFTFQTNNQIGLFQVWEEWEDQLKSLVRSLMTPVPVVPQISSSRVTHSRQASSPRLATVLHMV
jgi:hypothetical protein